ncbi:MAG: RNA polymerase sigma factor [Archangium sp.]
MTLLLASMTNDSLEIAALYDAHAARVWRTCLRLGVPPSAIEDAVQDVFLTAHRTSSRFQGRSSPLTWLLGIAVRVAANLRRTKWKPESLDDAQPDSKLNPEAQLQRRRAIAQLERVLSQLPEEQREVVVLMDLEQLSAPEVADALEVKLNTVYSRLRLGRAALQRSLQVREEVAS